MPACTKNRNHTGFLVGRQLGKYIGGFRGSCQLCIAHFFQIRAKEHIADLQSHLLTNGTGHFVVVPGQDFGGHTMVFQRLDCVCGGFLRGIEERKIPYQHHFALVLYAKSACRRGVAFLCNGKNTEALVIEIIHCFQDTEADIIGQRPHTAITLRISADGEHFFHSAFCHHLGLTGFVLYHRGQTASEVKGDFIYLHIVFRQIEQAGIFRFFFLCLMDNRQIHQILIAGLEVAVEVSVAQNPCIVLTVYVKVTFQHNFILCQRSGFVGAKNIYGPEVLDGIQVLDDGPLFAHGYCAFGKAGRHNHGKHLRGQANGNRDAKQECFQPVTFRNAIDEEYQRNHDQHEADQYPGNSVDALGKAGLHRFSGNGGCHRAKQSMVSDTDDNSGRAAGNHIAAHEGNVCVIGHALLLCAHIGHLFDRLTLPRKTCLTYKQIFCIQNAYIGGNHIPGGQMYDIAHRQSFHGNFGFFLFPAGNRAGCRNHGQQFFRRVSASGFLYKAKCTRNHNHGQNNNHGQRVKILRRTA